jgi:soluble lytic murein transglycosylase
MTPPAELAAGWAAPAAADLAAWAWAVTGQAGRAEAAARTRPTTPGQRAWRQPSGRWAARLWSDDTLAWQVRAACAVRGSKDAGARADAIDAMSAGAEARPAWVYWRARARWHWPAAAPKARPRGGGAAEPAGPRRLACTSTASSPPKTWAAFKLPGTPAADARCRDRGAPRNSCPGLDAGPAAHRAGPAQRRRARMELHAARHGRPRAAGRRATGLRPRVWDRCINTSDRTRGRSTWPALSAALRDRGAGPSAQRRPGPGLRVGLIRQESRFIGDARSGVGASGPDAVDAGHRRWTARKVGPGFPAR